MSEEFDPYHVWLGIPPEEQPANRYRLLGIRLFESNPGVIDNAADRQMAHLRTVQSGANAKLSQRLLNEVSAARVCLLNLQAKAAYDQQLRAGLPAAAPVPADSAIARAAGPARDDSRVGQPASSNVFVAKPILLATLTDKSTKVGDWDALKENSESDPHAKIGAPVQSAVAKRKFSTVSKFIAAGIAAAVAIGIALWALAGSSEVRLTFDWPTADRAGATLAIDDHPVAIPASGPWEFRCPPGQHLIVAARPAYKLETTATLAAGEHQEIASEWKPKAVLALDWPVVERAGAALLIDGQSQPPSQREPLEFPVEPGQHIVRITRSDSKPFEISASIAIDKQVRVAVVLPVWATLVLDVPVEQRNDVTLSVDNELFPVDANAAALAYHLRPGEHAVHVSRKGFQPFDRIVTFRPGDRTAMTPVWQPVTTTLDPAISKPVAANDEKNPDKAAPTLAPAATITPVAKRPAPTAAAQAESMNSVKDTFKTDYAKKSPADELALAKRLFDAALDTKGDLTDRFTLFGESRDLAARAGNLDLAMRAIDQLAGEFEIDALEMKVAALTEAAKVAVTPAADGALAETALGVVDDAVAADQYSAASSLVPLAKSAARKTNDKQLTIRADRAGKDFAVMQQKFEGVKPAAELLKQEPDDPEANLTVGSFQCFWKDQWDEGLPKLAKGSDAKLKHLAQQELTPANEAAEQLGLGDAWWDVAETESDTAKQHLECRAAGWYQRALPGLSGLAKAKVESRLKAVETASASSGARGREVDLLELVDVDRVAAKGKWKFVKDGLTSDAGKSSMLEIPYQPPPEYDFKIVFTRFEGNNAITQCCSAAGRQVNWTMDLHPKNWGLFYPINGSDTQSNPTKKKLRLKTGQRYTSVIKVRKDRIQVWLDGKMIEDWKTDYHEFDSMASGQFPRPNALGIGSYESPTVFHSVKVTEITGVGKRLK